MRARADSEYSYDDVLIAPRSQSLLAKRPPPGVVRRVESDDLDDDYQATATELKEMGDGLPEQIQKKKLRRLSLHFGKTVQNEADDGFAKDAVDDDYWAKIVIILKQAIPAIFCAVANMVQENVNLIFIGQLNNAEMMAGVGMGNMIMNILGLTIAMGLNGALETLSSQAFGSSNLELCGVYLNRGRLILILVYIPITIILLQAERILLAVGQDPEVANYTLQYVKAYLPGLMLMGLIDGQRRFLNMMNQTRTPMIAYYVSIAFHIALSYIFVWKLDYGILGTGIASTLTNSINYIFLLVLSSCIPDIKEAIALPDSRALSGLGEYLKLGIPSTVMLCLEFWVFDLMILMAGYIGVKEQACQIVVINIIALIWMVSVGLQQAASSSIGQQIGKGNLKKARDYYQVLNQIACVLFISVFIIVNLTKVHLIRLFTGNEEIVSLCAGVITVAFFGTFPDLMQGYQQGVIRALGIQGNVLYVTIIGYWVIQIPGAYYFCFVLKVGHQGMWISMVMAQWFIAICFQVMISRADWNKSYEASQARQQAELDEIKQASQKLKKEDEEKK